MFESVVGQPLAREILSRYVDQERVKSPFLFFGPAKVGKTHLARSFVRRLNCLNETPSDFCDCPNCYKFAERQYVDYAEMQLGINSPSLAQMREFVRFFSFRPRERGWRVGLLARIDSAPPSYLDVLLKLLEEPGERTALILTSRCFGSVSPTIRSRCVLVPFSYLRKDELASLAGNLSDFDLYQMQGSLVPTILSVNLHYFRRAFRINDGDPGHGDIDATSLELEMRSLVSKLGYALYGNEVEVGKVRFGKSDESRLLQIVLALEKGLDYLRVKTKPLLAFRATEAEIRLALFRGK